MDINNSNENKQDNTNNQKTLNSSIKDEKSSENVKTESKPIKKKSRMYLVLLFLALTAVVMYVIYRGNYLEILELGENYLPIFWRNIAYMSITFIVNFLVLFILIYLTNRKIKNGLKPFFDEEKRKMPKILNKSLAFILSILVSGLTTSVLLDKVMLCFMQHFIIL